MADESSEDNDDPSRWPGWLTWDVVWPRLSRLAALAIILNEFFVEAKPRAEAVIMVGTLIAVPIAAKQDRRNRNPDSSGP